MGAESDTGPVAECESETVGSSVTNMMTEAAKAPDDQKPSQEALERLLHTGLVPATVAACWDGARAKLAGGGAEAAGGSGGHAFGHFFANRLQDFSHSLETFQGSHSGRREGHHTAQVYYIKSKSTT